MKEISPSVWVSEKAKLGENIKFGKNIIIYGNTVVGNNCIIEDNVVIGHPSPAEMQPLQLFEGSSLHDYYDNCTNSQTSIGENSIVRSFSTIYSGNVLNQNFDCGHSVVIRENCEIDDNCYVFSNTQIKGSVKIGHNCRIAGTICDRTIIGDFSSVLGHTVHRYLVGVGGEIEPAPIIANGVIIGREAVIIGNVFIDDFACISSNSVVTQSIPKMELFAGIPAKLIRKRTNDEIQILLKKMEDYKNGN